MTSLSDILKKLKKRKVTSPATQESDQTAIKSAVDTDSVVVADHEESPVLQSIVSETAAVAPVASVAKNKKPEKRLMVIQCIPMEEPVLRQMVADITKWSQTSGRVKNGAMVYIQSSAKH